MRILRVAQKLYPDVKGGAPYHVHAMSRDQAAMGHDVTVVSLRYDPDAPHLEQRDEYTVIRYDPQISVLGNDISSGLAQYIRDADDFDVVHAHSHLYFATNLAALKRRLGDIPLTITNHGLYSQTAPRSIQNLYLETLGKWTFNSADLIFCYTEGVRQRFRSRGIKPPIQVISNGIDHTRFTPDGPTSDLVTNDGPVVLSVIRLVGGKRPKDAIEAVSRLRETYPDVHLYLAGDGYLREELEQYVSNAGLQETVSLLGNVAYDEMPRLYRSCDVLLLPSEEEAGAPRVVLEAMATEKPFVITDMPQTTELLTDLGTTVPVGDPDAMVAAIEALLSDSDRHADAGLAGRELVEQEFNWQKTAEETTRCLEGLGTGESRR